MKNQNLLNARYEVLTHETFEAEVKHALRLQSKSSTNNQVNSSNNILIDLEKENTYTEYTNKDLKKEGKELLSSYESEAESHANLFKENRDTHKKGFPKFAKTFGMFLFTFPEQIKKDLDNPEKREEILKAGRDSALQFAKEFNCDLKYLVLHLDEKGNPHFQGITTNYNKENGGMLNIQTNKKNGEKMQDILAEHFEPLGYERGISKDISGRKHLSTEEYKEKQELKKSVENLKRENSELKQLLSETKTDLQKTIDAIIQGLEKLNEQSTTEDFLKLLARYLRGAKKEKVEKLILKYQKILSKKNKEHNKKVAQSNIDFTNKNKDSDTNTKTTKSTTIKG